MQEVECAGDRADTKDHMTTEPMTRIINADQAAVEAAARCLAAGGLLAFPTETVYGLGADACNGQAIARLYEAKGRPAFNPLICHVQDLAAAARLGRFDADAVRLGRRNHAGNRPKMAAAATRFLLWKTHFDPWAKGPSLLGIQPVVFPS